MTPQPAQPDAPGALALLTQSHAMMGALFPAESCHALSIDDLKADNIRFFVIEEAGQTLGTGALALMEGYAEVKSMFTDPAARGRGVADQMLTHLLDQAAQNGRPIVRLETAEVLEAAVRLYERHGFRRRGPFGSYVEDPHSLFMEKGVS